MSRPVTSLQQSLKLLASQVGRDGTLILYYGGHSSPGGYFAVPRGDDFDAYKKKLDKHKKVIKKKIDKKKKKYAPWMENENPTPRSDE